MSKKEVIYIDTEDDITSVIDKVTSSGANIIALVLPKRYATLKSSVNMKLLKKTADKSKKKIVLITKEDALLPLAGSAGVFVADTLKSRPAVPTFTDPSEKAEEVVDEADPDLDGSATIEELSDETDGGKKKDGKKKTSIASSERSSKIKSIKESSKIKVPNFDKFRLRLILIGLGVVALAVGWYVAFFVVPKATVVIKAQTSRIATAVEFTVDPNAEADTIEENIVVGEVQEISKTVTERFEATGEKDVGKKASGTITVTNCFQGSAFTIPAGTVFTESQFGFSFESTQAVEVPGLTDLFTCDTLSTADIPVVAQEAGDSRNVSARGYSIEGISAQIAANGGNMTGGTSEVVQVVSADDIQKAQQLLLEDTDENIRAELALLFGEGSVIIEDSFRQTNTAPESSAKAGDEVTEAAVSAQFTYSIVAVSADSMAAILEAKQAELVDLTTQSVLDNGASRIELELKEETEGRFVVTGITDGFVGPQLDTDMLAEEISGKRFSEAVDLLRSRPGVNEVDLELTPFWVFSVPSPDKTTITVEISEDTLQ